MSYHVIYIYFFRILLLDKGYEIMTYPYTIIKYNGNDNELVSTIQ